MRIVLVVLGGAIVAGVLAVILFRRAVERDIDAVDEMCALPVGTPVEEVIPMARRLKFSTAEQMALGRGIDVLGADGKSSLPWNDDRLPGLDPSEVLVGKLVIAPYLRHYCHIGISQRRVTGTRHSVLD